MKVFAVAAFIVMFSSFALADLQMTYPLEATYTGSPLIDAGYVAPGQTFDIVFSDNSALSSEWDTISVSGVPFNWTLVLTQKTDASLVARLKVPSSVQTNSYSFTVTLSDSQTLETQSAKIRIGVKKNLVDVSFARKSVDPYFLVGGKVIYAVTIANSSIAPETVRVSSNLPSNWLADKTIVVKPKTVHNEDFEIVPLTSGTRPFTLLAFAGEDRIIVESFASELNVKPTLKGEMSAPLSGFPFFTFTLIPFQLFNSLLGAMMQ